MVISPVITRIIRVEDKVYSINSLLCGKPTFCDLVKPCGKTLQKVSGSTLVLCHPGTLQGVPSSSYSVDLANLLSTVSTNLHARIKEGSCKCLMHMCIYVINLRYISQREYNTFVIPHNSITQTKWEINSRFGLYCKWLR